APADLVIRTSIEPDEHNRAIAIVADSESFYRSSSIQLEGDRAPKTTTVTFHSVPAGAYDITASLIGPDGHSTALAHTTVMVVGSHCAVVHTAVECLCNRSHTTRSPPYQTRHVDNKRDVIGN